MKSATDHQREIPPELAADCEWSLEFRADPKRRHVAGSNKGWGDENFQVQPAVVEHRPAGTERLTGGCLQVAVVGPDGEQTWVRFILMDVDKYRKTSASLGHPVLSDEERALMIGKIRF